jgi:hypothetical protein
MTAVPPVGPTPAGPIWPSNPVERVRDRWLDEPAREESDERRERRRRRRKAEPQGEPAGEHVDVRA